MHNKELRRNYAIEAAEGGDATEVIRFEAVIEHCEEIFLDDVYDLEGDCVRARPDFRFACHGVPLFQAIVPRGGSPQAAARILRKFADILEGPKGHAVMNMSLMGDEPDEMRYDEDGNIHVVNIRELRRLEDEEGDGAA